MSNKKEQSVDCDDVHFAMHSAVKNNQSVKFSDLATETGQNKQTFINRLNYKDTEHPPTVEDLELVVRRTGDTTPIEILCSMFGGRFTSASKDVSESVMSAVLHAASEQGDVYAAIEKAKPGGYSRKEKVEINRQISEAVAALNKLKNTVNQE
ncbi:MAG: phage regulatory CII family protein [Gammaproteobacteria bacterium]|nr:phage regulatory CII family protein [Gammaproteobacteria bacterium]